MRYTNKTPNFWYKTLACPNQPAILEEMRNFLNPEIPRLASAKNGFEHVDIPSFVAATPQLQEWLKELGCGPLKFVASVVFPPMQNQKIHTDSQYNDLALNFGLQVKNTITNMYKIVSGEPVERPYGHQGYTFIDYTQCTFEKVDQFSLEGDPILFNVHQLHNVINQTINIRAAISLRFVEDPLHLI